MIEYSRQNIGYIYKCKTKKVITYPWVHLPFHTTCPVLALGQAIILLKIPIFTKHKSAQYYNVQDPRTLLFFVGFLLCFFFICYIWRFTILTVIL